MTLLAVLLAVAGAPAALALSEWWTPSNVSCPTFDAEESCESFCSANQDRCGGATECTWRMGEKRPEC